MSLYEVLKASKTERFPDYWTLLWGRKLSASMIKTITGVLPLTFTAKGSTAADWVFYGNDDVGENLFDYSQGCDWASGSNGASYQKIIAKQGDVFTVTSSSALYALVRGYDANDAIISGSAWSTGGTSTYTAPASIAYVKVVFRNFEYSTITAEQKATINEIMLVKGSTAPDHYIPYQQGVGERTKNLFNINASALVQIDTQGTMRFGVSVGALEAGTYTLSFDKDSSSTFSVWIVERKGTTYTQSNSISSSPYTFTLSTDADEVIARTSHQAVTTWEALGLTNMMFVHGSTAPTTYIPYGYEIPLTISQAGQTDKTYDIYIGDSPLTEGETVTKTSTGVDIELFEGENVVSTTLYNKPTMEIKYK